MRVELDREAAGGRVPEGKPSWVQFAVRGDQNRRQGNAVVAEISVPNDASLGVLIDLHVEFEPRRPEPRHGS
ncbi:MAG: hypothetical protein U0835_20300 [Isosphaeraceae bacterium]